MGNLTFNIGVNSDDFIMKAEQMRFSIHALALESKKANNANSDFANILKKTLDIIGGTETLKDFASDVVRVRGEFEQLEISFATLLKNREKANVLMSQIIKTAAETPFNLKELAIGAKLLIEYGAEFEQVNDTLIRLGNIASGMGLPLEQLIELYGNVMEQGKLYEQNIDQFTIFGIPMLQGLADMLGVTTAKITELVSVGKIGFPEVQKVIGNLTNEGGQFYGLMDEQSRTISGKIENIRDAWESMLNEVGQSQEGIINESLNGTQYILDNYEQLGKAVSELVIVYGSYKAILITITALQRLNLIVMEQANLEMLLAAKAGMVVSQSQALAAAKTKLFTGAIKANTIALLQNPYTFIAAAVVGLGYAIYKVTTAETELEKAHSRLNEANMNVEKSLTSEVSKLSSLERKLIEVKKGSEEYNKIKNLKNNISVLAINALLTYLNDTQKTRLDHINKIIIYNQVKYMALDINARRNLELTEKMRDKSKKGTLLWVLDKTSTSMGGRLLRRWINDPLVDVNEINLRLEAVKELKNSIILRGDIIEALKKVYDIERLAAKIAYGSANGRDLISLKNSAKQLPMVKQVLSETNSVLLSSIYQNLDVLDDIYALIDKAIVDEPPISVKEGDLIKIGYDEEIDKLKTATTQGKNWIIELETKEREKTGIKGLKVGFNKVFGYFIEVTKSNLSQVPDRFIRKQTLANCERYITEELKNLENQILGAEEKVVNLEYNAFTKVRESIENQIQRLQKSAHLIATLDVLCSLATVAEDYNYNMPIVDEKGIIDIKDGRHPVIEKMLPTGSFVRK